LVTDEFHLIHDSSSGPLFLVSDAVNRLSFFIFWITSSFLQSIFDHADILHVYAFNLKKSLSVNNWIYVKVILLLVLTSIALTQPQKMEKMELPIMIPGAMLAVKYLSDIFLSKIVVLIFKKQLIMFIYSSS